MVKAEAFIRGCAQMLVSQPGSSLQCRSLQHRTKDSVYKVTLLTILHLRIRIIVRADLLPRLREGEGLDAGGANGVLLRAGAGWLVDCLSVC